MPTHHRILSLPLLALFAAPLASGCNQQELPKEDPIPRVLYGFESCDDLLEYAKENAKESLDEYGSIYGDNFEGQPLNDGGLEGDGEGTGGGDGGVPGVDYSETNVQELGVDEPDLIKTDGERIVALAQGQLHHVDASGTPTLTASLPVEYGYGAEMFLYEDRVLLFQRVDGGYFWGEGDGEFPGEEPLPPPPALPEEVKAWLNGTWTPITKITEIDISDPAALKIVANLYVTGDYLSARRQDAVSRVVLRSAPTGLKFEDPWTILEAMDPPPPQPATQEEWEALWAELVAAAKEANAAIIDASTIDNWVPHYVFEDVEGGKTSSGLLLECEDAMHPGVYSGLTMTSVLTIDLEKGLSPFGGVGLFADGAIVYASTDNLYVSTAAWQGFDAWGDAPGVVDVDVDPGDGIPPEPGTGSSTSATSGGSGADEPAPDADAPTTSFRASEEEGLTSYIHKFATPAGEKAIYQASGEVRGRLLNQWAMHEARGELRVATTDQQGWDVDTWESFVSVLRDDGEGELGQIGQVGGLGKGEEIKSVRYIGDVGYVVTFRQTDPLYTIDLKDHENPAVAGELKINGYSAYLHPLDETHLIGVGFDGTPEGQLLGVQVNLFDVSDIQNPVRTSQQALGDFGWTEVAFDHHAFLYWEPTDLTVFPVNSFTFDEELMTESYFMGAAAYTVDPEAGVQPFGTISHIVDPNDPWLAGDPTLRRSLVIGDLLYTVSESGLKASALADLGDKAWIEW